MNTKFSQVPAPALSVVQRKCGTGGNSHPSLRGPSRGCWRVEVDILRTPDLDFGMSDCKWAKPHFISLILFGGNSQQNQLGSGDNDQKRRWSKTPRVRLELLSWGRGVGGWQEQINIVWWMLTDHLEKNM